VGTILGKAVVDRARGTLVDPDRVRWTDLELLGFLNDGQRQIAIYRPDTSIGKIIFSLTVNSTLQNIPATASRLVKLTRNMGAGSTPGRPIRVGDQDELDRLTPEWHGSLGASVRSFTYDGKTPRYFYVQPAPSGTLFVEGFFQVSPTDCTMDGVGSGTTNSVISLDDVYSTVLHDYIVYRAKSKDGDAQNQPAASNSFNMFLHALGVKVVSDKAFDPNRTAPPAPKAAPQGAIDGQPTL